MLATVAPRDAGSEARKIFTFQEEEIDSPDRSSNLGLSPTRMKRQNQPTGRLRNDESGVLRTTLAVAELFYHWMLGAVVNEFPKKSDLCT